MVYAHNTQVLFSHAVPCHLVLVLIAFTAFHQRWTHEQEGQLLFHHRYHPRGYRRRCPLNMNNTNKSSSRSQTNTMNVFLWTSLKKQVQICLLEKGWNDSDKNIHLPYKLVFFLTPHVPSLSKFCVVNFQLKSSFWDFLLNKLIYESESPYLVTKTTKMYCDSCD